MSKHQDATDVRSRWLLPVVVSFPLGLQTLDTTIIGPALPKMAASLQVEPLRLNLAVTAYLVSLAVFLPASGWLSDRYGARRAFCCAIALFSLASGLCAMATSLEMLIACRILQGIGGSIMIPVGRMILLRAVSPAAMVGAMVWFTMTPAVARLVGPLVSGAAVTWLSWRWIFLSNVPLGLIAIFLAISSIERSPIVRPSPKFDFCGFSLLATSLVSFLAAIEVAMSRAIGGKVSLVLLMIGLTCAVLYAVTSRRTTDPIVNLGILKHRTYFTSVIGGTPLRLAIGAVPFLLPLLFQIGFGMSPIQSGLLTVSTAIGSFTTRATITKTLRIIGFRALLIVAAFCCSLTYLVYGQFRGTTPHIAIACALIIGGLAMSMAMVALQTLAFSEIPRNQIGNATVLSTMFQQVTFSVGVMLATELLRLASYWRGGSTTHLSDMDFQLAFTSIGAIVLFSCIFFLRLPKDVGENLREDR